MINPIQPAQARVIRRSLLAAFTTAGLLTLTACANEPLPPEQELQAAAHAITSAEQARVADYAAPELGQARDKLAAANTAVQQKDMAGAKRLAEQSKVDAELAMALAQANKAKAVNDEMKKSIESLEQEMQRNKGIAQ